MCIHISDRYSQLTQAKNDILSLFSEKPQKVYSRIQLADILLHNRHFWHLSAHITVPNFISFLVKHCDLRPHKFQSKTYGQEIVRYSRGEVSSYELALSLKPRGYLCQATAVTLHNLGNLNQKKIFLNVEQSPKPSHSSSLTQESIDLAFSREQRQSNLIYSYGANSVTVIAGKNTNQLGVEQISGPVSEPLAITNLERTLIDIVVRPAYAGGIVTVLKAYRAARDRVLIDQLLDILKKLDYVYPYHQSIGFLMQINKYPEKSYARLRAMGLTYDFYLTHNMQKTEYSKEWRLFFPKGLKA